MRTSTTRADYIGERLAAIKAYSNERAEKDRALIEELMKALTRLSNEVIGSLPLMEALARQQYSNFGNSILMQRAKEARSLLSRAKEAGYG